MGRKPPFGDGNIPDSALAILLSLGEPRHGYSIMQHLQERTGGELTLGPASAYTTLKKLNEAGLIEELESDHRRRLYRITEAGAEAAERNVTKRRQFMAWAEQLLQEVQQ